jgi:DNA recombination protein RmuC
VRRMELIKRDMLEELRASRIETSQTIQGSMGSLSEVLSRSQGQAAEIESRRLSELNIQLTHRQETLQKTIGEMMTSINQRLADFSLQNEQKLDGIRTTMQNRLTAIQDDNSKKLEQMRATVEEKLEKTLSDRIGQSFSLVSERLEQVYKGLGEMQSLAAGVGDLKKVLSNVKTRGVLGEIQLGAILEQILSHEQYEANVVTKQGSANFVEYAVKFPGDDSGFVYLPIDAKFPADAYSALCDAYESGTQADIAQATATLDKRIRSFAKDIHDKYLDPPNTTEFAVMFLPFEGLYAEVVRHSLFEELARDYKVTVAGPSTMAALLNSLQMGFRTLAIQKRSGEVWRILGAVKTEFDKFGDVLSTAQQRLEQANTELDRLVGVRTRQIQRKLQTVAALPDAQSRMLIDAENVQEIGE